MGSARSDLARVALVIGLALSSSLAWGVQLVTEEEARLPALEMRLRGITRGPEVRLHAPLAEQAVIATPFRLRLSFKARGGSKIDPESVEVSYLRGGGIDLLPRLKSGVSATGIDLSDVHAPRGEHPIRVRVADAQGRETVIILTLKVGS